MIVKREQLAVDQTAVERTQDQAPVSLSAWFSQT